jgi:hypothetical protein
MLHKRGGKGLTKSIMSLFAAKKPNITMVNHKDLYFRNYFLPENLCKGIDMIAEM